MDEDALTFGFLIASVAVFIAGLVWQEFWSLLFAMTISGNVFYETMGVMGFVLTFVGAHVVLYCALICLAYLFFFCLIFGIPAYLLFLALGLEYSIILAVIIGVILIYLIESHTIKVEHYTVTLNLNRRYIVKR
ncbi:MAG: hypothetical protein M1496_00230 [Candidatus Thermoplasmatota archaeon]|nr:hypothetical protein [Candidatus Thermoplasmatota archaeon]